MPRRPDPDPVQLRLRRVLRSGPVGNQPDVRADGPAVRPGSSDAPPAASDLAVRSDASAPVTAGRSAGLRQARHAYLERHGSVVPVRPRRRWALTPRLAALALGAVVLLGGAVVLRAEASVGGTPVAFATPSPAAGTVHSPAATTSAASPSGTVVVDVVGAVVAPGVVRLATGSRVVDAVGAAGGSSPDAQLSGLNLARVLVDGEQVVVPRAGEQVTAPPESGVAAGGLVDLNTATLAQLDALPGVGPVLAQRIVDARPFGSVGDLDDVPGIGPAIFARLRDLVTV